MQQQKVLNIHILLMIVCVNIFGGVSEQEDNQVYLVRTYDLVLKRPCAQTEPEQTQQHAESEQAQQHAKPEQEQQHIQTESEQAQQHAKPEQEQQHAKPEQEQQHIQAKPEQIQSSSSSLTKHNQEAISLRRQKQLKESLHHDQIENLIDLVYKKLSHSMKVDLLPYYYKNAIRRAVETNIEKDFDGILQYINDHLHQIAFALHVSDIWKQIKTDDDKSARFYGGLFIFDRCLEGKFINLNFDRLSVIDIDDEVIKKVIIAHIQLTDFKSSPSNQNSIKPYIHNWSKACALLSDRAVLHYYSCS